MRFSSLPRHLALMAVALWLGYPRCALSADAPAVKLSESGICPERGSSYYAATLHYTAFDTLADCIKAGGRLPKTSQHRKQSTDEQTVPSNAPNDGDGKGAIRSVPIWPLGFAAVLVIAVGVYSTFKRIRSHRRLRVTPDPSSPEDGSSVEPIDSGASSDEKGGLWARLIDIGTSSDERRLLKACLGSAEVAERLIQFELDRNSALSRRRAAAVALERIERDNR